ncbi:histidinol dehydrogenase [Clostridiaceae bacterium 35-E11]
MVKNLKSARPKRVSETQVLQQQVTEIIDAIKQQGDLALQMYNMRFDQCSRKSYRITEEEIHTAFKKIPFTTLEDLRFAARNIEAFAKIQKESLKNMEREVLPGVFLGHRVIPMSSCAGYVPGGRYPLPSSALMSMIPAKVAGVKRIVGCSPPLKDQHTIHPATLVSMHLAGATEIYVMGGAQAIATLAHGTESISPVDMIVGPGNQYVTEAKRQVSGKVGIDFLAGPSEVVVIADHTANPSIIAADILAQSEHDPQARGILLCTDEALGHATMREIDVFLQNIPTAEIAREAWINNGEIMVFDDLKDAVTMCNHIAPEHLEIQVENPDTILSLLTNYGALFIGQGSAEVFGDYVAGTNHILPTMEAARYTGGVWVGTFLKTVTQQRLTQEGLDAIAPVASRLAELEGLYGHKLAADIRLK